MGPQGLVQSLEGGPVGDVAAPTAHHELEERGRAERGSVEEDLEEEEKVTREDVRRLETAGAGVASLTCLPWFLKNSPVLSMTCSSDSRLYGCSLHRVKISHSVTPNAHTSLAVVNFPCGGGGTGSRGVSQHISH